ncbi:MAG: type I polyketide synthase [Kibdelosporangium sp.]
MGDIAIVGIDGRFPGAGDPAAYWDLLVRGGDAISEVPESRWDRKRTEYGGFIADVDAFDHEFFGISPREAEAMDPQQRLVLQSAWRAFEDACLDPRGQARTNTGVFIGVMGNEWAHTLMADVERITPHTGSGNGYGMIANRVSYHLDLVGPSMAVDTACSSSLVALHQACVALRAGECDQALAGGVNIIVSPALNVFYGRAGLSAADGSCKPFSRDADGIVRSEAVGTMVLRRIEDTAGLPVYAVIKGGAVNHNGRSNGLAAPNRGAQRSVIAEAYRRAGIRPQDVVAIEAHGTGTVLGDMIEVNALGDVHAGQRAQPLSIGAVKGNIGHAEGAAGIASVMKAALALHHGVLPASRHARTENPRLKLRDKGLRLLKAPLRLGRDAVLGVSGFGLGGTNAHIVLASAPSSGQHQERLAPGILTVSGDSPAALQRNAAQLASDIEAAPERRLGRIAWTSNQTKASGRHRLAVVATGRDEAVAGLEAGGVTGSSRAPVRIGWLFTGQGSQYQGMTRSLHSSCSAYRRALAEVDDAMGFAISDILLTGDIAGYSQPALFAVGYALGRVLDEVGAGPEWMIGHSVGEYAAAVHAGVLDLVDACRLVVTRGRLMDSMALPGGMLAVRASEVELPPGVSLAGVNGVDDIVLSGPNEQLDALAAALPVPVRRLDVPHAFHSSLMEPMLEAFAEAAAGISYHRAQRRIFSTVHGCSLGDDPMDASYWVQQVRKPVLFAPALRAALDHGVTHMIEIGPRPVLSSAVHRQVKDIPVLSLCLGPQSTGTELLSAIARLYSDNLKPRWDALYDDDQRVPHRLTPYSFSTANRFWSRPTGTTRVELTSIRPVEPSGRAEQAGGVPDGVPNDVAVEVLSILADVCGYEVHELSQDMDLYQDLGFDSIMLVQLKQRLEGAWNREMSIPELAPSLTRARDLVGFVQAQLAAPAVDKAG